MVFLKLPLRMLLICTVCTSHITQEAMKTPEGKAEIEEEWASDAGVNRAMARVYTVEERVPLLLIHSMLHLLGYDHETDEEWEEMTKREEEVMQLFYKQISLDAAGIREIK